MSSARHALSRCILSSPLPYSVSYFRHFPLPLTSINTWIFSHLYHSWLNAIIKSLYVWKFVSTFTCRLLYLIVVYCKLLIYRIISYMQVCKHVWKQKKVRYLLYFRIHFVQSMGISLSPTLLACCICNVAIVNLHSYHDNGIVCWKLHKSRESRL